MPDQPSLFRKDFIALVSACLHCGGDPTAPDHARTCDGRQGKVEAMEPPPPDERATRGQQRYRRILAIYRETSRDAYESVSALLPAVDARIVSAIEHQHGATCDEVEQTTGFAHQTVSAQIRHLYEAGLLTDTPERRPTRTGRAAVVWVSVTQREKSA